MAGMANVGNVREVPMTEPQAERLANVMIGLAAIAAAYYVLKTPSLRRMAWRLARTAVTASGPAWLVAETRRGWDAGAAPALPARRDMIGG
jgi:hypothetical protein